jgi:hypothetical protein
MKYLYNLLFLSISVFSFSIVQGQIAIAPKKIVNPSFGLNGGDIYAYPIATTNDGYTYAAGMFDNTIDFDITADTFNISSTYQLNMFIAKYDKQSHLVFAFKLSGLSGYDDITAIATDKDDNIYVAGIFAETIDFDPGPGTAILSTGNYYTYYLFIAKYDKDGNYIFAKPLVSDLDMNSLGQITSMVVDDNENIFIAGEAKTPDVDFDPGSGTVHPEFHGRQDAFFAKYDVNGNYVFVKSIGSGLDDGCGQIAINKNKDIIIVGSFGSANNDFNPNPGKVSLFFKGGNSDAFVGRYDSLGNYKYAFSLGGLKDDGIGTVAIDNDNNFIVEGTFYGNVDFAPDSSVVRKASDADNDYFLAKYTTDAQLIFVTTIHSDAPGFSPIAIDNNNNIYMGGTFDKTVVFTPTDSLVTTGAYDGFWAKYNSKGRYLFSKQITGKKNEAVANLVLRNNNQVCIAGSFDSTSYFDSKEITTQNFNCYIATYSRSGNILRTNAFGTYRKFIPESAVVKMAHDAQNNTYVAGTFEGIVDFDPAIKEYILTSSQDANSRKLFTGVNDDIFFAKYNANGQLIFAKDIGGTAGQQPLSISVDNKKNIYLTGEFEDKTDVDPGSNSVIFRQRHNPSMYDAYFFGKYDSLGNYIFAKPLYISGYIKGAVVDKNYNIYIAGDFNNGYFDPDNDTSIIRTVNNGEFIYFAKYNSNGKFLYLKSAGIKNKYQSCNDIAISSKGNIVLCGEITGSQIDFDPGPGTYYANTGAGTGHFIAAYSPGGNFLFENNAQAINSTSNSNAQYVRLDKNDNITIAGTFNGSLDMNSGPDTLLQTGAGVRNMFLMRYNNAGVPLFAKGIPLFKYNSFDTDLDLGSFTIDDDNNMYAGGDFYGKIDFDPGDDTAYLYPDVSMHSNTNLFLARYDSSGNYEYAYNFAATDTFFYRSAFASDIWVNKNSDINWAIKTNGTIDFDPGPDTFYYHPPFDVYASYNQSFSFAIVRFKQKKTVKPFTIYASTSKPDIDKTTIFDLNKLAKYLK